MAPGSHAALAERLRQWARLAKRDVHAISLASRDPRVPWYAKVIAISVAAYALSPIDLIPDFVPILGYLDDIVLVPLGIMLAVWLIPADVLAEHRAAADVAAARPASRVGAAAIAFIWLGLAAVAVWVCLRLLDSRLT